jgi:hypothetical protein
MNADVDAHLNRSWPATATTQPRWPVYLSILAYSLALRLTPYVLMRLGVVPDPEDATTYPWNFSPIWAACLFGGACLAQRSVAIAAPLATYLLSDLGIWALTGRFDWAFYPGQFVVYLTVAVCVAMGFPLRGRGSVAGIAAAGFASCTLFYLTTNYGWWALSDSFPHTAAGLVECYVAGLAHYRNSLASTALFSAVLFSPLGVRRAEPVAASSVEAAPA